MHNQSKNTHTMTIAFLISLILVVAVSILSFSFYLKYAAADSKITILEGSIESLQDKVNALAQTTRPRPAALELGEYFVNQIQTDESGVSNEDCSITLLENNAFHLYMGWGMWHEGSYDIQGAHLICRSNVFAWDGGPGAGSQLVDIVIRFEKISENKIRLVSIEDRDSEELGAISPAGFSIGMTYSLK